MAVAQRSRSAACPAILSGGFRPFFLLASIWAAFVIPVWLVLLRGHIDLPTLMPPLTWHVHELVFGYASAVVAGFLLTAVPNWTGRLPIRGWPLAALAALWVMGRMAVMLSSTIGGAGAAVLDLAFPLIFLLAITREIVAGRNWRNLPVAGALILLLSANLLVHLGGLGIPELERPGLHLGIATLLMLIALIGGRIIPSFTRNWLVRQNPQNALPAPFGAWDRLGLALAAVALLAWVVAPEAPATHGAEIVGGLGLLARLARWRPLATAREPLLWILHLGYGWLALGLVLLGMTGIWSALPANAALHALTVGAIGTMTLAVMTRASLGHSGRPLIAGRHTVAIYVSVTLAAILRFLTPAMTDSYWMVLALSGLAWSTAFALFVLFYAPPLMTPRSAPGTARAI